MEINRAIQFGFTAKQIIDEGRTTEDDISLIKTWQSAQNLPTLTEEQISLFLLSCNNEQEPTKATIEAFYSVRNGAPGLFSNRKLERADLQKQLRTGDFCVFPERTHDGCSIMFFRFRDTNYGNFDIAPFMALLFMTLDAAIFDHPPKGIIMLYDMNGMGIMHLTRIRLGLVRTYFQYLQEGLPVKLKNIHLLNSVYFINKIMSIIRPFAKAEVLDNMHFHPRDIDMEKFYKEWLPRRCLPEDYGGDLPSVEVLHQENIQKLTDMQTHFEAEELQRQTITKS